MISFILINKKILPGYTSQRASLPIKGNYIEAYTLALLLHFLSVETHRWNACLLDGFTGLFD